MDKGKILILALAVFALVSMYSVSAHFVCGQVLDSSDNTSASWSTVRIFYPSNPLKFTTCQVSPQENKYCCDSEAIPGKTWKIGDVVSAEIFESHDDLAAGPVSVTTTGESYDIFPTMQLEKVINVYKPNSSLIISKNPNVLLNASFLPPYNTVSLNNITLCNNCSNFFGNVSASFGDNNWQISSTDGANIFYKNISFTLIKNYNFTRKLECDNCKGLSVKDGSVFAVFLKINLSNPVNNQILTESVPSDFKILNSTGSISIYSSDYNTISWNVSGSYIEENYTLEAPSNFWASDYEFSTELGGEIINTDEVNVFKLVNFFPVRHQKRYYGMPSVLYLRVSNKEPYVIHDNGNLIDVAFFPNSTLNNVQFQVLNWTPSEKIKNAISYYLIKSNIEQSQWGKTYVDFKVNKNSVKNSSDVLFMSYNNSKWNPSNITLYNQDNENFYFRGFITGNAFAIVGNRTESPVAAPVYLGFRNFFTGNVVYSGNQTGNLRSLFNFRKSALVGNVGAFADSLLRILS